MRSDDRYVLVIVEAMYIDYPLLLRVAHGQPPDIRRQIINDSNVQSLNGVDVSLISRPFDPPVEVMEIDLDETESPDSHDGVSAENTSGQPTATFYSSLSITA
ncbi:hypothetical protein ACOME3_003023 [Neoechinorhynchus agilis]